MEQLEFLKSLGLEAVSNKTHINIQSLNYIIDKKFDKLNKTKAMGFIKILEREYDLDLSEWKREYNTYLIAQKEHENDELFVVADKEEKKRKNPIFLILLILFLFFIIYQFFIASNNSNNISNDYASNSVVEKEPVIEEAKKNLDEINSLNSEPKAVDINDTNKTFNEEQNITTEDNNDTKTVSDQDENDVEKEVSSIDLPDGFLIEPKSKIWAGVIYLDDFTRKQFLTDENITLDASREQLIVTGHAAMNMYINRNTVKFDSKTKVRFLYKEGILSEISFDEFKIHNKGVGW